MHPHDRAQYRVSAAGLISVCIHVPVPKVEASQPAGVDMRPVLAVRPRMGQHSRFLGESATAGKPIIQPTLVDADGGCSCFCPHMPLCSSSLALF